jgi:hypothetical protein
VLTNLHCMLTGLWVVASALCPKTARQEASWSTRSVDDHYISGSGEETRGLDVRQHQDVPIGSVALIPISATGAVPGRRYSLGRLPSDAQVSSECPSPGACRAMRALGALVVDPRPPLTGPFSLADLRWLLPGRGGPSARRGRTEEYRTVESTSLQS